MFIFLVGVYAGCYASLCYDAGIVSVSFDFNKAWKDIVRAFAFINAVRKWAINVGCVARDYVDHIVVPALAERGVEVTIPSVKVPSLTNPDH